MKAGGSVGIGTNGPESNLHVRSAAVSGKHLDSLTDLLVEGTDTRLQVMASDGGSNGSAMLLSTQDHHWIHHAHATTASNMYSLGYYNSSGSGFDGAGESSEILNITTAGNVGIQTGAPSTSLHVYDPTANGVATFESGDNRGGIALKDNSTTQPVYLMADGNSFIVQVNAAERLRINSSGRMGIATNGAVTDIPGTSHDTVVVGNNSMNAAGVILSVAANGGNSTFGFYDNTGTTPAARMLWDSSVDKLMFYTRNSSANGEDVRMTIDDTGRTGIGITSPVARLDVAGYGAYTGTTYTHNYAGNTDAGLRIVGDESTLDILGNDSGDHASSINLRNGVEGFSFINNPEDNRLEIKSFTATGNAWSSHSSGSNVSNLRNIITFERDGNVGIGESNPNRKLTIGGGDSAKIGFTGGGTQSLYFGDGAGAAEYAGYIHYSHSDDQMRFNTTTDFSFTGGNVGIGTASPKKLLHLYGDENAGGLGLVIQDDGWGAPNGLFMTTVRNSDGAYTIRKNTATAMDFSTYTDMLSVEGNGHVGIGTANAIYRLDVQGGKIRHRGATTTGNGNLVMPNNTHYQSYNQENGFQIAAENSGSWASHILLTNVPSSGNNTHWDIHHYPTTGGDSIQSDGLTFKYQSSNAVDVIGGDGAGTNALTLQSNGSAKFNNSTASENMGVLGRTRFHGADYQQIKLHSGSNQGWAGIQFQDQINATTGTFGQNDADQYGFLRYSHGDGMNQTVSGQTANAGYVFGSSENVTVISFQSAMSTTSYGNYHGEIRFGSGVNTTYSTSSDRRIKENITTLASGSSKTKILAMNPVTYNLINDPNETPVEHTGFIAQEMHEIMPEIVQGHGLTDRETGEDTIMSIDYSKLTPVLVGALQDALAEIETLKARLDAAGIE